MAVTFSWVVMIHKYNFAAALHNPHFHPPLSPSDAPRRSTRAFASILQLSTINSQLSTLFYLHRSPITHHRSLISDLCHPTSEIEHLTSNISASAHFLTSNFLRLLLFSALSCRHGSLTKLLSILSNRHADHDRSISPSCYQR